MPHRGLVRGVAVALLAGSLAMPSSPAQAVTTTLLGSSWPVQGMVPDVAHKHLYLLGFNAFDVRTDLGAEIKKVTLTAVRSLALSTDGSRLLAATDTALVAYDTTSVAQVASYPLTCTNASPGRIAVSGTKVWFGCSNYLGVIDLGVASPVAQTVYTFADTVARDVAVNPVTPTQVLANWPWGGSRSLSLVDTSAAPPVVTASVTGIDQLSRYFAFSSDGTAVIGNKRGPGSGGAHPRWSTTDLSPLAPYGTSTPGANALTVSTAGYIAGGYDSSATTTDVWVYDKTGSVVRTLDLGTPAEYGRVTDGGLVLTPDGSRLYALTYQGSSALALKVIGYPTRRVSSLSLTPPTGVTLGTSYVVKGTLSSSDALPAGKVLTVKRSSSYGTVTRPSVTTGANGAFTIADKPAARGSYTYTVSWAGDATHLAVARSAAVYVKGKSAAVSASVNRTSVTYGGYVTVTGHLITATTVRTLSIYAQPYGGTAKLLKTATVDAYGNVKGSWKPSQRTWYYARFPGDSVYEPASAGRTVYVHPAMSATFMYSYGRSGSYYLFHKNAMPHINVTLHPIRGGCLKATQQQLVSGSWKTIDTNSCEPIYSGQDMSTGYSGFDVYDPTYRGTYRVQITLPGSAYYLSTTITVYYRYTA